MAEIFSGIKKNNLGRFKIALLFLLSQMVTFFFSFLGAPLLRVLYRSQPRIISLIFLLLWSLGFFYPPLIPVASLMLLIWLPIILTQEFETQLGWENRYINMFVSSLLGALVTLVYGYIALKYQKIDAITFVDQLFVEAFGQVQKSEVSKNSFWLEAFNLDSQVIYRVLPSVFFLISLSHVVFAYVLDSKAARVLGIAYLETAHKPKFLAFKSPDLVIWAFLVSFLLSFYKGVNVDLRWTAINILLMVTGVLFFHGLAVFEYILYLFRAGLFIRILVYVLLVGQMFYVLVFLALADYWLDIRLKLTKYLRDKKTKE